MRFYRYVLSTVVLTLPALAQPSPAPKPFGAADVSQDDAVKLVALNAIMRADPERGVPLAEGILKGGATPTMKDRAMSALSQSRSPRAQQAVTDFAKTSADPELQLRAIRAIGRTGAKETQQQLAGIYPTASDARVKQEILRSLMTSGASDSLLSIAKAEKDQSLRNEAVRNLANSESTTAEMLTGLYAGETDSAAKKEIANRLAGRGDAKALIELGRGEKDVAMKAFIVGRLAGMSRNKDAMDYMMELLK